MQKQHMTEASLFVCQGSNNGPKQHGGAKTSDKELSYVSFSIPILTVQVVDIRALQPITGHHERVNEEVVVLEGIESGGRVDAILVVLAELEGRDDGAESPEHHVVEDLHSLRDCDSD